MKRAMCNLSKPGNDFEDNVQIACAILSNLDGIVTRDIKGFKNSLVPVLDTESALKLIDKEV